MTLGATLQDTIDEERMFTKKAALRSAEYTEGEQGAKRVEAFEGEIKTLREALTSLIERRVPSVNVAVSLKGDDFKIFWLFGITCGNDICGARAPSCILVADCVQ